MHENNVICQWRICRLYFIYIIMKHHDFLNSKFPMSETHPTSRKGGKLILYIRHANLVVNIWKLIWLASIEISTKIYTIVTGIIQYTDVIMGAMASQITSLTIVYSAVCSGADERIHQSSASLAFVRGMHRWPVNSPHDRWIPRTKGQ